MREESEKFIAAMNKIMLEARTPSLSSRLKALGNDSKPLLESLRAAVNGADKLDLSQLKPEFAEEARTKHIAQARQAVFDCLKRYITLATSTRGDVVGRFWHYTAWSPPSEALARMASDSQHREIRDAVRAIDSEKVLEVNGKKLSARSAFVMEVIQGEDKPKALNFIHALVGSPDSLVSSDLLNGLRLDYTRVNSPELYADMTTAKGQYDQVRKMAGLINAQCIQALGDIEDPISEEQRQSVFPPRTPHEQYLAQKRLLAEQREIDQKERNRKLEQSQALGLNLAAAHQAV